MVVKHLPPTVKQLLTLRTPQPRPTPSLPRLTAVLSSTFQDAKAKKAERGWLTLAMCTLLTANAPPTIGHLYRFATRDDLENVASRRGYDEALSKAALMRESALKSCIFVGVPRTILSLASLHETIEDDVRNGLRKTSVRTVNTKNVDEIVARGEALWATIYTPHAEKLRNKLGSYHPDFIEFIIQAYGAVLAPLPGGDAVLGNLSRAQGSIVGTACLRAEGGVGPQLTSHVFGLLKARDVPGLSAEDYWLASDEGTEWVVRTVDKILDVVKPELALADADGTPQAKL
ncbi:Dol-P-Man:Man(5)GlcNAc(2)-PP-Dol alpha-1,3-mannosyltransferase [Trametes pubescens]|uniref:Dol-P-Man:Man(5)GlcNAc(2)-PP-Dol alpha-1,3-mannosyltransferase n=1 Tax=Trametes pubescens TaxID=154538 RepID=A0A1M2W0I6_TRAPU|nr:Dol-P-Man:Man(5)GlcNAc(2)-PP-Dol alpha-1,3-mannosyltransferase [Trametes pubescens]